jgi:hypothetical protein
MHTFAVAIAVALCDIHSCCPLLIDCRCPLRCRCCLCSSSLACLDLPWPPLASLAFLSPPLAVTEVLGDPRRHTCGGWMGGSRRQIFLIFKGTRKLCQNFSSFNIHTDKLILFLLFLGFCMPLCDYVSACCASPVPPTLLLACVPAQTLLLLSCCLPIALVVCSFRVPCSYSVRSL